MSGLKPSTYLPPVGRQLQDRRLRDQHRPYVGAEAADLQILVARTDSSRSQPQTTLQRQRAPKGPLSLCKAADYFKALKRTRLGLAPSSPRRFFLSASYSW